MGTSAYTLFGTLSANTEPFKSAMKSADVQLDQVKGNIDEVEKKALDLGKTTAISARGFDKMREAVAGAQERLKVTAEAFEKGEASAGQMRAAMVGVERATAGLDSRLKDAAASAEDFANKQAASAQRAAAASEAAARRAAEQVEKEQARSAAAAERAQQRVADAAEKAAARQEADAARVAERTEREQQRIVAATEKAAQRAIAASEKAAAKQEADAARVAARMEKEQQRVAAAAEKASQRAANAAEKAGLAQERAAQKAASDFAREQQKMADAAERAAERSRRHWEQSLNKTLDAARSVGQGIVSVGAAMSVAITAPLVLAGKEILTAGAQYETALNVFQQVTGATEAQMKSAAAVAKQLGSDITLPTTSAADAANAMVELGKAGFTTAQSMDAAKGVLQLAAAAQIAEAQAAEIAANAINAFNLEAKESGRVADLLAAAANASSAEISDVALAMQQASAVFAGAKIPIEDLTTAIGLMANAGIKGSDAGTSLKTFLQRLQSPADKAADAMDALGIKVFDAQGKMYSLTNIIGQFEKVFAGMTDQKKAQALTQIFGSDAIRAAQILFREGTAGFDKMKQAVTQNGAAASAAEAKTRGLGGAWESFKSQLETIGIQIYEAVAEPLTRVVRYAAELAGRFSEWFGRLTPVMQQVGIAIAAIAGALGPVLIIVGTLITAVAGIGSAIAAIGLPAIGIAIAAITGIVLQMIPALVAVASGAYLLYRAWTENWSGIQEMTSEALSFVYSAVIEWGGRAIQWWQENWPAIQQVVEAVADGIVGFVKNSLQVIEAYWNEHGTRIMAFVKTTWTFISTWISAAITQVGNFISLGLSIIQGDWDAAWQKVLVITKHVWSTAVTLVMRATTAIVAAVKAFGPIILQNAKNAMLAVLKFVGKAAVNLLYLIATLPYQLVKLVPKFYKAGQDIAGAIWEGIKSGVTGGWAGGEIPTPKPEEVFPNGNPLQKLIDQFTNAINAPGMAAASIEGKFGADEPKKTFLDDIVDKSKATTDALSKVSSKIDEVKAKTAVAANAAATSKSDQVSNQIKAKMTFSEGNGGTYDRMIGSTDTNLPGYKASAIDELVRIGAAAANGVKYGEKYTGKYNGEPRTMMDVGGLDREITDVDVLKMVGDAAAAGIRANPPQITVIVKNKAKDRAEVTTSPTQEQTNDFFNPR